MGTSVEETVAHLRRRTRERAARGVERRAELERWLPIARDVLRSRGAESVYVFGSVANGTTTARSDLDLAVAGLPRAAYFAALGELMRTLPCEVDLVRLEDAPESLRERVRAEGREL